MLLRRVADDNPVLVDTFSDVMVVHINVLTPIIEDGVFTQCNDRLIVHHELRRSRLKASHVS
jgi:hypothetical protein